MTDFGLDENILNEKILYKTLVYHGLIEDSMNGNRTNSNVLVVNIQDGYGSQLGVSPLNPLLLDKKSINRHA